MAILQDYYNTNDDSFVKAYADEEPAQTFIASANYPVYSIKCLIYKIGSPPGNTGIRLYTTDENGHPDTLLQSVGFSAAVLTSNSAGEWKELVFSSKPILVSGTKYAIRVQGGTSMDADNCVAWRIDASSPTYANGNRLHSTDNTSTWTDFEDDDCMFEVYSTVSPQTSGPDITAVKKLVAAGNNEIWYESSEGTMTELSAANGDIDTTDQFAMFESYQKVFIANGANLKVADFINTKITVTALTDNRCPAKGDILTQDNGSGNVAHMVVDFVNTARTNIYGYAYYTGTTTAFITTVDISSNDATGSLDPNPIPNANISAITAAPHWYDWTAYPDVTLTIGSTIKSFGSLPNKAYLGCLYRGRNVISGDPEHPFQWFMSRQTHPWDFAYVANDAGSPVKGGNSDAGEIGDIIRALIPYKDDFLIFGCASTMWFLAGDPMFGGSINELDLTVGIFGSQSWCFDGEGSLYFWGTNGIYVTQIPGVPNCITEINLPNLVNDEAADPSTHKIVMVYDRIRKGILTCITKLSDGTNSNYWYDLRTGGFFPESYPDECGVYSAFHYPANSNTYKDLVFGCRDGYIRKFDPSAKDDDKGASDQLINSYVKFGPIPMSQDPDKKGKLSGLNLTTAGGGTGGSQSDSSDVGFKIFVENSAEKVIEKLSANTNPKFAGTFKAPGKQAGAKRKQKIKGAYLGIRLDNTASTETWGFEKLTGTITSAGKVK